MNFQNMRYWIYLILGFLSSAISLESVRECWADQKGGLILPIGGIPIEDRDWIKYKSLKKDKNLKPVNPADLPSDFCKKAYDLVDEFRRKTVNLKEEWMLYFDYLTGDVIYCWQGEVGKISGNFNREHFEGRHIASLHSHPIGYYSFPSPDNFDILKNDFEDYEIISSINAVLTVEFKGSVDDTVRNDFQTNLWIEFNKIEKNIKLMYKNKFSIRWGIENASSSYLLNHIDKSIENIELNLVKKGF